MKSLIKNLARKFSVEIRKAPEPDPLDGMVSLQPEGKAVGRVLISYILEPFLLKPGEPVSNIHTHYRESLEIARVFLGLGYAVDVIDYRNERYVPEYEYDLFVGARTNFARIAKLLNKRCIKVVHLDTAHWVFNNYAYYRRSMALQRRRGVTLPTTLERIVESNLAIEHADCATVLGNRFTMDTYSYAGKPLYRTPISTCGTYPGPDNKEFDSCRSRFLWFGNSALLHKGLDLVLEAFADLPKYHLTVCGMVEKQREFVEAYRSELYNTPNIHLAGWMDVNSPEFTRLADSCVAVIHPSCAEGGGGSVINCMHAGLIPVVSYEASVDVSEEYGVLLAESSPEAIRQAVSDIASLPTDRLRKMAKGAWRFAREHHTLEHFSRSYREAIVDILAGYPKK